MNSKLFSVNALAQTCCIGRTTLQGKVLSPNDYSAPINVAKANDVVRWGKRRNLTRFILFGKPRARTMFSERSRINQEIDSLSNGQAPFFMVLRNVLGTSLLSAQPFTLLDFLYLFIPICHAESFIFGKLEGSHPKPIASSCTPCILGDQAL